MPLIYRSMLENEGKPAVGSSKKHLGVTTIGKYADIEPDAAGWVHPLTGGMSVSPDLQNLPQHRVPMRLKTFFSAASGKNNLYVWCLGSGEFTDAEISSDLRLRVDKPEEHGIVEPSHSMPQVEYEQSIATTRSQWRLADEEQGILP